MNLHAHWIVTTDGRGATLYSCTRTPGGELHLETVRSLHNVHEREHERHRPSLLGGAERRGPMGRSGANAAQHSVSVGHEADEEQLRFAREVREWLLQASRELPKGTGAVRLDVFSAPRFLGLLRDQLGQQDATIVLHEGELTHLRPHELAIHPMVLKAVIGPPAAGVR